MRGRVAGLALTLTLWTGVAGCTALRVEAARPGDPPKGVRVYLPSVYLLVDSETSEIVTLPDLCRPYDLRPVTVLARQDFAVEAQGGVLSGLEVDQDTTAILTFVTGAGELAARSAGIRASAEQLSGNFGLAEGIYQLAEGGGWVRLDAREPRPCQGWAQEEQP